MILFTRKFRTVRLYTKQLSTIMEKIVCKDPSQYDSQLSAVVAVSSSSSRPLFVLFTGAKKEETGKSWCPDCVAAEPVIEGALNKIEGGCILLECPVEREQYRSPDYLYRTNNVKLKCVPTLHKFVNGKSIGSLDDNQSQNPELVDELIRA